MNMYDFVEEIKSTKKYSQLLSIRFSQSMLPSELFSRFSTWLNCDPHLELLGRNIYKQCVGTDMTLYAIFTGQQTWAVVGASKSGGVFPVVDKLYENADTIPEITELIIHNPELRNYGCHIWKNS